MNAMPIGLEELDYDELGLILNPSVRLGITLSAASKRLQVAVAHILRTWKCINVADCSLDTIRFLSDHASTRFPLLESVDVGGYVIDLKSLRQLRACDLTQEANLTCRFQLDMFSLLFPNDGSDGEDSEDIVETVLSGPDADEIDDDREPPCTPEQWAAICVFAVPIIAALQLPAHRSIAAQLKLGVGAFQVPMPDSDGWLMLKCFKTHAYPMPMKFRAHARALLAEIIRVRAPVITHYEVGEHYGSGQGKDDEELAQLLSMLSVGAPALTSLSYPSYDMAGPHTQRAVVQLIQSGAVPSLESIVLGNDEGCSLEEAVPDLLAAIRTAGIPVHTLEGDCICLDEFFAHFHIWPPSLKHVRFGSGEWNDSCATDTMKLARQLCAMPSECALESFQFHSVTWHVKELHPSSTATCIKFDDGMHSSSNIELVDFELAFLFEVLKDELGGAPQLTSLDCGYCELDLSNLTRYLRSPHFPSRLNAMNLLPVPSPTHYNQPEEEASVDDAKELVRAAEKRGVSLGPIKLFLSLRSFVVNLAEAYRVDPQWLERPADKLIVQNAYETLKREVIGQVTEDIEDNEELRSNIGSALGLDDL